jgi:hypothetical protein
MSANDIEVRFFIDFCLVNATQKWRSKG